MPVLDINAMEISFFYCDGLSEEKSWFHEGIAGYALLSVIPI